MRGVDGSARAIALEHAGLISKFKVMVGVSTGAPVVLYAAGGVIERGTRIYYEESMSNDFLSWSPRRFWQGTSAHMGYQCDIYRGVVGQNPADIARALSCPADLCVGVTDYESGKGSLVDIKTAIPDPIEAVHASIAVPLLYRRPVKVNGRRAVDGAIGIPFPAQEVVERWNLDGVVVLANRSSQEDGWAWKVAERSYRALLPKALRQAMRYRPHRYAENLAYVRRNPSNLIFWTNEMVQPVTRNAGALRRLAKHAYEHTRHTIERAGL